MCVTRGTSLAIGVGILYALVIEGLLSAFATASACSSRSPSVFLRANGYSIAAALGASVESIESSGPGSFGGPFVGSGQALAVLVAFIAGFARPLRAPAATPGRRMTSRGVIS